MANLKLLRPTGEEIALAVEETVNVDALIGEHLSNVQAAHAEEVAGAFKLTVKFYPKDSVAVFRDKIYTNSSSTFMRPPAGVWTELDLLKELAWHS